MAAAEAAAAEGEHSAATTAAAPLSKKQKAALLLRDSSSESMLFAPISHMLDGFVAAAARGAEEEAAKAAAAAAAAAEAEAGTAAAAAEAAPVPAPSEEGLLASVASDGARAAAAETAALWTRQLTNERRSLEAARARYSADLVQLAELGICPSAAAPRGLTRRLYLPMVEAVREEQLKVLSGVPGTDRRLYGPFLLLLPPEDYAAIALQGVLTETLKLSAKSLNGRGGGGRALVVEASGGRERGGLEVSDADAADLMARSLRDPLTAFDAALEASLPSAGGAAEAPGVGLRGPLGKAAAREPGFAPFTGLARHLGRGVRDTVSLGRLAAVVKREGTSQGKLVRLWDAARGRAAARGGAGLTPADEKELLDEFARVGSSTEAYVEGEFETGKRRRRGKGRGAQKVPEGRQGHRRERRRQRPVHGGRRRDRRGSTAGPGRGHPPRRRAQAHQRAGRGGRAAQARGAPRGAAEEALRGAGRVQAGALAAAAAAAAGRSSFSSSLFLPSPPRAAADLAGRQAHRLLLPARPRAHRRLPHARAAGDRQRAALDQGRRGQSRRRALPRPGRVGDGRGADPGRGLVRPRRRRRGRGLLRRGHAAARALPPRPLW